MTELKPCPFCGVPESEDRVNFDHHKDDCYLKMTLNSLCKTVARYAMEISHDGLVDEGSCTPEQIHRAWNTRTERTCHPVRRSGKSFSEEEKKTTLDACCSECRGFLGEAWEVFECECDLFCSGCGAKVVE